MDKIGVNDVIDHDLLSSDLLNLLKSAPSIDSFPDKQTERYIESGEYALALDDIAWAFLKINTRMPPDLFQVFEKLANEMNLAADPEYKSVAKLREVQAGSD